MVRPRYIRLFQNAYQQNRFLLLALIWLFMGACENEGSSAQYEPLNHSLIPVPQSVAKRNGEFTLSEDVVVIAADAFQSAREVIQGAAKETAGINLAVASEGASKRAIRLVQVNDLQDEEYRLTFGTEDVLVEAHTPRAAFYAAQTFRQWLWSSVIDKQNKTILMQAAALHDKPAYAWRGFHVDVARHFFAVDYIKQIIDWMSMYKLNKLHLHLTDDQGWRIQMDGYPLLTEVGAWRTLNKDDSTCLERAEYNSIFEIDKRFLKEVNGTTLYGGYYTKQDIREIVAYAQAHFIDVIPEIDMPGHMSAAIRAYPDLSCTSTTGWGKEFSFPLCACKEETIQFVLNVWDEVLDLFPAAMVHIGVDEVDRTVWSSSPICQQFLQQHGLKSDQDIQDYFVQQLQQHLEARGKKVIAWDDVIEGKVSNQLLIMYWRSFVPDAPHRAIQNGHDVVMTPWTLFYLSSYKDNDLQLSSRQLYEYDVTQAVTAQELAQVKGFQACVWTETIPSEKAFEYYVFPRFQAFAEVAWGSPNKNWDVFQHRMEEHRAFMNREGIGYRKPGSN